MDEGLPESWEALEPGTPVLASDGTPVGEVKEAVTLSNDDLRMVAAGTAAKLLGIEAVRR